MLSPGEKIIAKKFVLYLVLHYPALTHKEFRNSHNITLILSLSPGFPTLLSFTLHQLPKFYPHALDLVL